MGDVLIIEPITLSQNIAVANYTVTRGTGHGNLITNDPREIFLDGPVGNGTQINIDFGQNVAIDTVYLGNTSGAAGDTWGIAYGNAAAGAINITQFFTNPLRLPSDDVAGARGPAVYVFPAPINMRYLRITIFRPAGQPLQVGSMIVGNALRPSYNKEIGSIRQPLDSGTRTRLDDGGLTTVAGSLISGYKWVFGDLTDAERKKIWGIIRRRRTTEPVLVIEDADDLVEEGVHYCTLIDLEGYLRSDPTKNRWALSVEDWL